MKVVKKRFFDSLTADQLNKIAAAILAVFLLVGGILYWQQEIGILGFVFFVLFALVIAGLLVFDTRVVQKDGFLDGYARGKDNFDKEKKA